MLEAASRNPSAGAITKPSFQLCEKCAGLFRKGETDFRGQRRDACWENKNMVADILFLRKKKKKISFLHP